MGRMHQNSEGKVTTVINCSWIQLRWHESFCPLAATSENDGSSSSKALLPFGQAFDPAGTTQPWTNLPLPLQPLPSCTWPCASKTSSTEHFVSACCAVSCLHSRSIGPSSFRSELICLSLVFRIHLIKLLRLLISTLKVAASKPVL